MAISRTVLFAIALPVPAAAYLATSMTDVSADSQCLPSAQAVTQQYPGSWASWSSHVANHRGVKCWFPVVRETRSRHVETALHHTANRLLHDGAAVRKDAGPARAPSPAAVGVPAVVYSAHDTDFRWPPVTVTATPAEARAQSSFEDRFAASREAASGRKPALMRNLMDPTAAPDAP